jgi:hypothetical protein
LWGNYPAFSLKGKLMTYRITKKDLENGVRRLNTLAGTPQEPWTRDANGNYHPQPFCYHLSGAYGGYMVQQVVAQGSGCSTPITCGHVTKRACYETLHAFISGFEAGTA